MHLPCTLPKSGTSNVGRHSQGYYAGDLRRAGMGLVELRPEPAE